MKHPWRLALLCVVVTGNVSAANLLDVYERSLTSDPLWQQAAATELAIREVKTQALINLLPIDLSASGLAPKASRLIEHTAISPGPDPSTYVFIKTDLQRNLFRIPLH